MKKITYIFAILTITISAYALEWNTAIQYLTRNDASAKWTLQDDGNSVYIRAWQSTVAQPSKAELEAVEATAIAWKKDKDDTDDADFDVNWTRRERAMMRLMVKEINILRQAAGLQPRTAAQVKAALKAEME